MADDDAQSTFSTFSTSTRMAVHPVSSFSQSPNVPKKQGVSASIAKPLPEPPAYNPKTYWPDRVQQLEREMARCDEQIKLLEQINDMLKRELSISREACRSATMLNLVVYKSRDDISIASVSDSTTEGLELFERTQRTFQEKRAQLSANGIAFGVFSEVPVNNVLRVPF